MNTAKNRWSSAPWFRFDSISSTNTYLMDLPYNQIVEGMICSADMQTSGYGRGDRQWASPYGGLYLSILLIPDNPFKYWHLISFVMAVAAAQAIKQGFPDLQPGLKWPNDVLIGRRKIAGILVQCSQCPHPRLVVGIGINVSVKPESLPERTVFPAGIINLESSYPASIDRLRLTLKNGFFDLYREWLMNPLAIIQKWETWSTMIDKNVELSVSGKIFRGKCVGLAGDGALKIRIGTRVETFYSGDIVGIEDL
ncbi:biotin--[acetyl-CoA-carboxylase] ligase [bacterium]|nr:biotin--[acetyl-CoA-carboxylase] ligase [candidate division CSSED10-310 bacterium]